MQILIMTLNIGDIAPIRYGNRDFVTFPPASFHTVCLVHHLPVIPFA